MLSHNLECPVGYEIHLPTAFGQGQGVFERLGNLRVLEVHDVASAYAVCDAFDTSSLNEFEEHLLTRIPQMDDDIVVCLLKNFAQV